MLLGVIWGLDNIKYGFDEGFYWEKEYIMEVFVSINLFIM